jgi:hypothetical protein
VVAFNVELAAVDIGADGVCAAGAVRYRTAHADTSLVAGTAAELAFSLGEFAVNDQLHELEVGERACEYQVSVADAG